MILLSPSQHMGHIHIQSCKVFDNVTDMIDFLKQTNGTYNSFSICPRAYEISTSFGIKELGDEWHQYYVYPYIFNTRSKNECIQERS